MPSNDDLERIVKLSAHHQARIIMGASPHKQFPKEVFDEMKKRVPTINIVYGHIEGYNPEIPITYCVITRDQVELIIRKLGDFTSSKLKQEFGVRTAFLAIEKPEDLPLSEFTDGTKIVTGMI